MEVNDSELRDKMYSGKKLCYRLGKTLCYWKKLTKIYVLVSLRFLNGMVISRKGRLSAERTLKPGRSESVLNHRNVNTMEVNLRENQLKTCKEIVLQTNISKMLIFHNPQNNLRLQHFLPVRDLHHLFKNQCK